MRHRRLVRCTELAAILGIDNVNTFRVQLSQWSHQGHINKIGPALYGPALQHLRTGSQGWPRVKVPNTAARLADVEAVAAIRRLIGLAHTRGCASDSNTRFTAVVAARGASANRGGRACRWVMVVPRRGLRPGLAETLLEVAVWQSA